MTMNVTISLADRYAAAKYAFDEAAKALEDLKAEVKALGMPVLHGVTCDLTLSLSEQMRIDTKLIPADIAEAARRPILVETIRVKAKGAA